MQIKVYYSADAGKFASLSVQPTDTVKAVKQKIIALHAPPDWANEALLSEKGSQNYFENRKQLAQCGVQDGATLKFAYARNLTTLEKVELSCQGVGTGTYQLPAMAISTLPAEFSGA
ncbi:unnamed protein product [Symbiodinium natans]|uniref:Ubiquitin-like domain-containing protein n=1 Tax=Symbiodinium natans TaxID=878477 RepID=A0A812RWP4_9DINO|nr:unnamed protein product [Symbiodinium natans]